MNNYKNYFEREIYTLERAEEENMIIKDNDIETIPFGYINDQWEELKLLYKKNDLLYKFINKKDKLFYIEQKKGFELVRKNEVIYTITTELG